MFIAKIKNNLGLGLLLALSLGVSTNYLWAAEAAGSGGGVGGGAGYVNRYAALSQAEKDTELLQAAKNGRMHAVQLLLAAGADVNERDQVSRTALINAALMGHLEVVQLLLENGANVNVRERDGYSALMMAAIRGDVAVVRLLLAAGADVNLQAQNGSTALVIAADHGHVAVVRLLLAAKANVNLQGQNGFSALIWAAVRGHIAVVRLLLAAGADVNVRGRDGYSVLMMAAILGDVTVMQLLLAAGAEVPVGHVADRLSADSNARIQTALVELETRKAEFLAAAATGNLAKINELIALPICGDRRLLNNQALLALAGSETDIPAADFAHVLDTLLAHGADINYAEFTVDIGESKDGDAAAAPQELMGALDLAIQQNNATRVSLLITRGADPLRLSNATRERLAPFTLRMSRAGASAYAAELAENWENRLLDMQDVVMSETDKERYLEQAFAIAQVIKEKVIELSKEGRERRLMAREDQR